MLNALHPFIVKLDSPRAQMAAAATTGRPELRTAAVTAAVPVADQAKPIPKATIVAASL